MKMLPPFVLSCLLLSACHAPGHGSGHASGQATASPAPRSTASANAPSALQRTLQLVRYHWHLADAVDAHGRPLAALLTRTGKPLQLDFNASVISVTHACKQMSGHYLLRDGAMQLEPLTSAGGSCPQPAQAALYRKTRELLQGTLQLQVDGEGDDRLRLVTAHGDTLTFHGSDAED